MYRVWIAGEELEDAGLYLTRETGTPSGVYIKCGGR